MNPHDEALVERVASEWLQPNGITKQASHDIELAIGGSYELPDGRSFWLDAVAVKEIMRRAVPVIAAEGERRRRVAERRAALSALPARDEPVPRVCAICKGPHDNDLGSDICRQCEADEPWLEAASPRDEAVPASGGVEVREKLVERMNVMVAKTGSCFRSGEEFVRGATSQQIVDILREAAFALTQQPRPEAGERWVPRTDAVVAVAKALAEHLTGKAPTEQVAIKAATFLWNCIDKGALSPLAARLSEQFLPEAGAIKALKWVPEQDRTAEHPKWRAAVDGLSYEVFKAWWGSEQQWGFVALGEFYRTEAEAKAAAQADYEARIRACLMPTTNHAEKMAEVLEPFADLYAGYMDGNEDQAADVPALVKIGRSSHHTLNASHFRQACEALTAYRADHQADETAPGQSKGE